MVFNSVQEDNTGAMDLNTKLPYKAMKSTALNLVRANSPILSSFARALEIQGHGRDKHKTMIFNMNPSSLLDESCVHRFSRNLKPPQRKDKASYL